MNRVGNLGQGESVWMAWFLAATLKKFVPSCKKMNDLEREYKYTSHIDQLKNSIEENAWDGDWYLRAYFDNGEMMGSHHNSECKIDAIAQSWSIISGLGDKERAVHAMDSVDQHLIDRRNKIVKLFTPPFDKSTQDPGYIKGYVPGVRENGGQYTHAAIWTMMAFALNQDARKAHEIFSMINPINHARNLEDAFKYKVEPYVIAADIYGVEPHVGRGGWSWYTGSASWMYRAALENLLGFKLINGMIKLNPCIPEEWDGFELIYRRGKTIYEIKVKNNQEKFLLVMNGTELKGAEIPLLNDEKTHQITINLSAPPKISYIDT